MPYKTYQLEDSSLRKKVRHFLSDKRRRARLDVLRRLESENISSVIFGGAVRDIALHTGYTTVRDVDVVVQGIDFDGLVRVLSSYRPKINKFGGLKLQSGPHWFDIWRLEDTWAIRNYPTQFAATFDSLPATAFLTVEAVAIQVSVKSGEPRRVIHKGFLQSLSHRVVELVFDQNPDADLSILRSLVVAQELNFAIGPKLVEFIAARLDQKLPDRLYHLMRGRYRREILTKDQIEGRLGTIHRHAAQYPMYPLHLDPAGQMIFSREESWTT